MTHYTRFDKPAEATLEPRDGAQEREQAGCSLFYTPHRWLLAGSGLRALAGVTELESKPLAFEASTGESAGAIAV